jgi:hypothetical protein
MKRMQKFETAGRYLKVRGDLHHEIKSLKEGASKSVKPNRVATYFSVSIVLAVFCVAVD